MLDFARSYAPLVRNVVALMSQPECIQVHGLSKAQMAALRHHGQMRIDLSGDSRCEWLVVGMRAKEAFESTDQAPSWRWVQTVRPPHGSIRKSGALPALD